MSRSPAVQHESSGKSPFLSESELAEIGGFELMILPNYVLQTMIGAAEAMLKEIDARHEVRRTRP